MKSTRLNDVRINGIAVEHTQKGQSGRIWMRGAITSDNPLFHRVMQNVCSLLSAKVHQQANAVLSINHLCNFVLVTHAEGTADLFLEPEFPMSIEILAKRDVKAEQAVSFRQIGDIGRLKFPWLTLSTTNGVFICLKVGWKFGLFIDLEPDRHLDIDAMEVSVGQLFRYLTFQGMYEALEDPATFALLTQKGWFPFVEIIGEEFNALLRAYQDDAGIEAQTDDLLAHFDSARIDDMTGRWWRRPALALRREILQPAIDAFKRNDPVSCLKIALTELEGILQELHIAEVGAGGSIKELLKYAADKGMQKAGDESSLLFPKEFLHYMSESTYSKFDPKQPDGKVMSRHSVGHGGASASAYTRERALQALLTIDQVVFYL